MYLGSNQADKVLESVKHHLMQVQLQRTSVRRTQAGLSVCLWSLDPVVFALGADKFQRPTAISFFAQ